MNIPIYRAKVKGSDKLIEGWFFKTSKAAYIIPIATYFTYIEIELETLEIYSFPDSEVKEFKKLN